MGLWREKIILQYALKVSESIDFRSDNFIKCLRRSISWTLIRHIALKTRKERRFFVFTLHFIVKDDMIEIEHMFDYGNEGGQDAC